MATFKMFEIPHSLHLILQDEKVTEIILQSPSQLDYETSDGFLNLQHPFSDLHHYTWFIHKILDEAGLTLSLEKPCGDGKWGSFRVHAIMPPLSPTLSVTLRRQKKSIWTLQQLSDENWCTEAQQLLIRDSVQRHDNILILGATGSGKTSALEGFLSLITPNERCIIIEDSEEIHLPNPSSTRLLTRYDSLRLYPDFSAHHLIKQALRMRPHRLMMGEIRGDEAKDFLMTLSTGHKGSLATIHADNAPQALLRLEMLVQLGAPQWSLESIRRLIGMSLDLLVTVGWCSLTKKRKLLHMSRLAGVEATGILLDPIF